MNQFAYCSGSKISGRCLSVFRNRYLSVSRINTMARCPSAFGEQYVFHSRRDPELSDSPGAGGSIAHGALEDIFSFALIIDEPMTVSSDQILSAVQGRWEQLDANVLMYDTYQNYLGMVRDYFLRHPVIDPSTVLGVENSFTIQLNGFKIFGLMDRVDRLSKDAIRIVDYKTNFFLFTEEEVRNDLQPDIYILAARERWPWAKRIEFQYEMLRFGKAVPAERTEHDLSVAKSYITAMGRRSEDPNQKFEPRLNPYCGYCDFRSRCGAYKQAAARELDIARSAKDDIEEIAHEREKIVASVKILETRKRELDSLIKARLDRSGSFVAAGHSYAMADPPPYAFGYPAERAVEICKQHSSLAENEIKKRILTVDSYKLDALVRETGDRMLRMQLDAIKEPRPIRAKVDGKVLKGPQRDAGALLRWDSDNAAFVKS